MNLALSADTLLCALAVLVGACLQGASGIGFALFAAPIVALIHPELVPGPMILLGGGLSLMAALRESRHIDYRAAGIALAGRVPGTLAAGLAIGLMPLTAFARAFALSILLAIGLSLWGWRVKATPWALGGAGFASGFMGTISSVGAPPMGIVLQNAEPAQLRATIGLFLVCGSTLSVVMLAVIGRFGWVDLQRTLLLAPAMLLGFWLSNPLKLRIRPAAVRHIVLVVCALSALALLFRHA